MELQCELKYAEDETDRDVGNIYKLRDSFNIDLNTLSHNTLNAHLKGTY